jgi:hypothetical protein
MNFELPPGGTAGGTTGYPMSDSTLADLQKALTAGYGTDVASLSGGGALRVQSLDMTLQATIQENKHFRLFNKLSEMKATATVDEWTEMSGVGGFPGGSTNSETGVINTVTGQYNRRVGQVKYLMTQRQVSYIVTLQNAIVAAQKEEYIAGALQLLTDAEYLLFEGDSSVVPTEFDGIYAQINAGIAAGQVDPGNIIDVQGNALNDQTYVTLASRQIRQAGNFGQATDIYFNTQVQSDFDNNLNPAFRVALTDVGKGGLEVGAPVVGIRTSGGNIMTQEDVFIRDDTSKAPFQLLYPSFVQTIAPASVTVATASNASSRFTTTNGATGNYYWGVAGVNMAGQSVVTWTSQTAISSGQAATLTITQSASATETGYVIYRSRVNGTGGAGNEADIREMLRIPRNTGGSTTTYVDLNADLPGASKAFVLNLSPGMTAITWRKLKGMFKFDLYPSNQMIVPWAQAMFGYLRISKRRHHVVIKNIVPIGSAWKWNGATGTSSVGTGVQG